MTFLKKLGSILSTVTGLFLGFAPVVQKAFPQTGGVIDTVSKDLSEIGAVVVNIEAIGQLKGLSGPDKAAAAGPLVAQIILNSTLVAGKKIADPAKFQAACATIAGGVADVLNSLHEDAANQAVQQIQH